MWQFHLVENYQGGSAMMVRIHHCIADGIALIAVTQSLVDGGAAPPERKPGKARREGFDGAPGWITDTPIEPFTNVAAKAFGRAGQRAADMLEMLTAPKKSIDKGVAGSVELARIAWPGAGGIADRAGQPGGTRLPSARAHGRDAEPVFEKDHGRDDQRAGAALLGKPFSPASPPWPFPHPAVRPRPAV